MKTLFFRMTLIILSVPTVGLAQEELRQDNPPTQVEENRDAESRLRDLIKQFEDDPVESDVDREKVLADIKRLVEKLNRAKSKPAVQQELLVDKASATEETKSVVPVIALIPAVGGDTPVKREAAVKQASAEQSVATSPSKESGCLPELQPASPESMETRLAKAEGDIVELNRKLDWLYGQVKLLSRDKR